MPVADDRSEPEARAPQLASGGLDEPGTDGQRSQRVVLESQGNRLIEVAQRSVRCGQQVLEPNGPATDGGHRWR